VYLSFFVSFRSFPPCLHFDFSFLFCRRFSPSPFLNQTSFFSFPLCIFLVEDVLSISLHSLSFIFILPPCLPLAILHAAASLGLPFFVFFSPLTWFFTSLSSPGIGSAFLPFSLKLGPSSLFQAQSPLQLLPFVGSLEQMATCRFLVLSAYPHPAWFIFFVGLPVLLRLPLGIFFLFSALLFPIILFFFCVFPPFGPVTRRARL